MRPLPLAIAALFAAASPLSAGEEDGAGTSIVAAGVKLDVGRPVVLWDDPQGFNGYETGCIEGSGGCCAQQSARFGVRKGVVKRTLAELRGIVYQLVLHFDGCVNSRSCFVSMHNRERPGGGCGLSAHFMVDADGTIYQTLDLVERAYHAEQSNPISIGVEICNRGRVDRREWPRLPKEYQTRPTREVIVNGGKHLAYDFRPEQYESLTALARTLLREFPRIRPVIPERDGKPLLESLPDPLAFEGVLGHLHVDQQRNKWDPGALDWARILRALHGFHLPIQVRSFAELPRETRELQAARRALFINAEERATGFFPIAPLRLWHSGVHLRGTPGVPVVAVARGRIVAARRSEHGAGSSSFVLIRHEAELGATRIAFFSLSAHVALPPAATNSAIPWLQAVAARPELARDYAAGRTVLMDQRVEPGDRIGAVGLVSRGPEQGPEVHFEIFTTDRLPGSFGRAFRHVNAVDDGALVRQGGLVAPADRNGDLQLDGDELARFFREAPLAERQSLRWLAIRHRHEWGDRNSAAELASHRELTSVSAQVDALHAATMAPFIFWDDALSRHAGLPDNQIIHSHHPLTFLLELAARTHGVSLPSDRGSNPFADQLEPRRLPHVPVELWLHPTRSPVEPPLFGPPVGMKLGPKKKSDIPLLSFPSAH